MHPRRIELRLELGEGGVSEREPVAILPGSTGSIARSRGDTPPRQARATTLYPSAGGSLLVGRRLAGIPDKRETRMGIASLYPWL